MQVSNTEVLGTIFSHRYSEHAMSSPLPCPLLGPVPLSGEGASIGTVTEGRHCALSICACVSRVYWESTFQDLTTVAVGQMSLVCGNPKRELAVRELRNTAGQGREMGWSEKSPPHQ